jgi:hypothetical protein
MDEQSPQAEGNEIEATQSIAKIDSDACKNEESPVIGCNQSLASTTSKRVCILISLGIALTHALLLWGQIDPQWSVYVCEFCLL